MDYLSLKNVTKKFGREKTFALNKVSFDATKSEIVGIIGSSGSGKTTLLRIISGLEIPQSGKIVLNDNILNDTSVFVAPENRNCTLVFQDYALFPHLTVLENINFGKNTSLKPGNVKRLLEIAKIKDLIARYPHEISGGEQQRVALIRAMATNPNLLLLDEPLAHLDYELKEGVRSELMNIFTETDTSVLFVSHDIEDSMKMADKLVVLNKGEVEQIGTPMEIYSHPVNRYVAMLLGKTNLIPRTFMRSAEDYFIDDLNNIEVISVRPNQFIIEKPESTNDSPKFTGKISALSEMGSFIEVVLSTGNLDLLIHFPFDSKVNKDEEITVSITNFDRI